MESTHKFKTMLNELNFGIDGFYKQKTFYEDKYIFKEALYVPWQIKVK